MLFYAHLSARKAQASWAKMVCLIFNSCDETFVPLGDMWLLSTLLGSLQQFEVMSATSACLFLCLILRHKNTSYFKDVSSHICFDTQQDELIQVLHDVLERVSLCWSLFVKNQVHFYKSQIFFSFYLKAWKYIKGFTKVELISIQYILSRTER